MSKTSIYKNSVETHTHFSVNLSLLDWWALYQVELAPLEVAIETVETKNSDISSMVDEFTNASGSKDINPLSMLLNGVIDAAVCGGTVQYKKVC